jgi:hypothetical protein
MSCVDCKDSILNANPSGIGHTQCLGDCPPTVFCESSISSDCIQITSNIPCSNLPLNSTLTDFLINLCNTCCNKNNNIGGIIYNNTTTISSNYPVDQTLVKDFNHNYIANNAIRQGDILEITTSIKTTLQDDFTKFRFYLGTGNVNINGYIYQLDIPLTVIDVADGYLLKVQLNVLANNYVRIKAVVYGGVEIPNEFGNTVGYAWNDTVGPLDFTNLTIGGKVIMGPTELASEYNDLVIEIKKLI